MSQHPKHYKFDIVQCMKAQTLYKMAVRSTVGKLTIQKVDFKGKRQSP